MGRRYYGIDLNLEQCAANAKYASLHGLSGVAWGRAAAQEHEPPAHDLLFTCPPYHDREVYSDDPRDLSAMDWGRFTDRHQRIMESWVARLKISGFAVWVVGSWRDKAGGLVDFPGLVVAQGQRAGLQLWDRLVLREPLVTAQARWRKPWDAKRRTTRTHQEIIVFKKVEGTQAMECPWCMEPSHSVSVDSGKATFTRCTNPECNWQKET